MKLASIALLASTAAAFAPSTETRRATTTLQADLWGKPEGDNAEKSKALPFANRPKLLDGTLAGDVGFE